MAKQRKTQPTVRPAEAEHQVTEEQFERDVAAATAARMVQTRDQLLPVVRPVYGVRHRGGRRDAGTVHLFGNAVLFTAGGRHFALTAAHVLDEFEPHGLGILGEPDMLDLSATRVYRTVAPAENRDADRIDVGFVELSDAQVATLGNVRFLTPDDLDVTDAPSYFTYVRTKYLLLGYPASKQGKLRADLEVDPQPLAYAAQAADPSLYKSLETDPDRHLLLPFDQKAVISTEGRATAPKLDGMSGCGVWRFDSLHALPGGRDQLVGLFIEWHRGSRKVLVATRIDQCLEGVRHSVPELEHLLPRRKYG